MMPCSSDLVPSISLQRRQRKARLADASVERADLEEAQRGVVDAQRQREVAGEEVQLRLLAAVEQDEEAHSNWKNVESTPWNVTMISRISTFSGICGGGGDHFARRV